MIQLEILDNGKKFSFPENLSECDKEQYIGVSKAVYLYRIGAITYPEFQLIAINSILGLKPSLSEKSEEFHQNIAFLLQYIDGFFSIETNPETDTKEMKINLGFTHNPISLITHSGFDWVGPSDGFESVKFGQYVEAMALFFDYAEFQERKTLEKLFATLYRPKISFLPKKLWQLHRLDEGILYGVYLLFASFQEYVANGTIFYNGQEIDLSIIYQNDSKIPDSKIPGIGMKSILFDLAASGVFGAKYEVEQTPLWEVLLRLYDSKKKSMDEKAYYESIKTEKK